MPEYNTPTSQLCMFDFPHGGWIPHHITPPKVSCSCKYSVFLKASSTQVCVIFRDCHKILVSDSVDSGLKTPCPGGVISHNTPYTVPDSPGWCWSSPDSTAHSNYTLHSKFWSGQSTRFTYIGRSMRAQEKAGTSGQLLF